MLNNELYDRMDSILHRHYNKYVQMKKDKKKYIVKNLNVELEKIVEKLREADHLFDKYFSRFVFTGSYWERIRVKEATEFDVNLVFKLPDGIVVIRPTVFPPGHAYISLAEIESFKARRRVHVNHPAVARLAYDLNTLRLREAADFRVVPCRDERRKQTHQENKTKRGNKLAQLPPRPFNRNPSYDSEYYKKPYLTPKSGNSETYREIERWIYNGRSISPELFLNWLEGVFDKAGIKMRQSVSKSGPAITGEMPYDRRVTVDYTPVFEVPAGNDNWFAVPKPYDLHKHKTTWRVSICEKEKEMLKRRHWMKFLLKLVKKVRDDHNMVKLASYHIKTIFLLELRNRRVDWTRNIGRLFMHMLSEVEYYLENKFLPAVVDDRLNLFRSLDKDTLDNMYGQIKNLIHKINLISKKNEYRDLEIEQLLGHYF